MEQFSSDLQDINSRHSLFDDALAAELSNRFPAAEHAVSAADGDELAAVGVQAAGNAAVITLLPLESSPQTRQFLEQALRGIVSTGQDIVVVDMDIADPHTELLGSLDGEGISDHFLYGVSPSRLLVASPNFESLKVLPSGTFTPRAAEIYANSGWNELLETLAGEAPNGTLVLLAPPADKYPSQAALGKTDKALIFAGRLSPALQQQLPDILDTLAAGMSEATELRFVWIDTERPEPESQEPEESVVEKPDVADEPPVAVKQPAPISQLSADNISLEDEIGNEQETSKDALDGFDLPDMGEVAVDQDREKTSSAEDDEEEIFLPEELLFLDEGEEAPPESRRSLEIAAATSDDIRELDEAALELDQLEMDSSPAAPDEQAEIQVEEISAAGIEAIEPSVDDGHEKLPAEEEIEDIDRGELEPAAEAEPATEEISSAELEDLEDVAEEKLEVLPADEAIAEVDSGDLEPAAGLATDDAEALDAEDLGPAMKDEAGEEELDTEALFSDDDLSEELTEELKQEAEVETPAESAAVELDSEALAQIENFRQAADQPGEEAPELVLDSDPLGQGESAAEAEEVLETAPELEEAPVSDEDVMIEDEELAAEVEQALHEPDEDAGADELEAPSELDSVAEDMPSVPEDMETVVGEAEPDEGEIATELEALPADELEAEVAPDAVEELSDEELEELEMDDIEPIGDQEPEEASTEEALELDEVAGEAAKPAAAGGEGGLDIPDDAELNELLSGADDIGDLGDLDTGITLDELDEIGEEKSARKTAPKKKKKKTSKSSPMALVVILLLLGAGLFFVWKQGYVSGLVRQYPALGGIAKYIPGAVEQVEDDTALRRAVADSLALADSLSRIPPPPDFEKLGYSVQIGSFRYLAQALAARDRLIQNGLRDVYVVPLELDSLGNWNRLYLGMFETAGMSDTALLNLQPALTRAGIGRGSLGGSITRHTPLTLIVAEAASADSLQDFKEKLESNMIPAYVVKMTEQDSTRPPLFRLYSGAFENEEQAVFLRNQIFNLGVRARVVEREGPAKKPEPAEQEPATPPV